MRETWRSLEATISRHLPRFGASLRSGAADASLAALEATIGDRLPDDVREHLRVHDGQRFLRDRLPEPEMLVTHRLLSAAEIAERWETRAEVHESWPYLDLTDSDGDAIVANVRDGVIYFLVHAEGVFGPIAPSLRSFFVDLLARLASDPTQIEESGTHEAAIWIDDYNPASVLQRFPRV